MQPFFQHYKKMICISTLIVCGICIGVYFAQSATKQLSEEELAQISSITVDPDSQMEYRTYSVQTVQMPLLKIPDVLPERLTFKSTITIPYPSDGVRGIYVSGQSAGSEYFSELVELLNQTKLNTMVIDVKEDLGKITMALPTSNATIQTNTVDYITNSQQLMKTLEENQIYPIARIVVFKDSLLATSHPEWSFIDSTTDQVWVDTNQHAFVNPFQKEVWDYNIEIAIEAAKMGFKEIQFDYIRFPEGFATFADSLTFEMGDYATIEDPEIARVQVINDFLSYARERLKHYNVIISADVFGYTATIGEDSGIGQNFTDIAERVDVISSMIYPSHWGDTYFGILKPDLYPYEIIYEYAAVENELLASLGQNKPQSRPWLQDFTASYLGTGNYLYYGAPEVSLQIEALRAQNIHEYLLWDSANDYSYDANY